MRNSAPQASPLGSLRRLALALPWLLSSCGIGTGAVVSGLNGSSARSNADPVLDGLLAFSHQSSPLGLRIELQDAEQNSTDVLVRYALPGGPLQPATLIAGPFHDELGLLRQANTGVSKLATSAEGEVHYKLWDFEADGLGAGFREDVRLLVELADGSSRELTLELGNDAPVLDLEHLRAGLPAQLSGISLLRLALTDPAEDEVLVRVEFRNLLDDCFLVAHAAGAEGEGDGDSVDTEADGAEEIFYWDTDHDHAAACLDLSAQAGLASLRFVVTEVLEHVDDRPLSQTVELEQSVPFDNNSDPIAVFQNDLFIVNPDQRGGLPIPFAIIDEESHDVSVAIQWRRESDANFLALPGVDGPGSVTQLAALLADPRARREQHICTEYPLPWFGRVGLLEQDFDLARQLRLPELASSASSVLRAGIVGANIDLLRDSGAPALLEWSAPQVGAFVDIAQQPLEVGAAPTQVLVLESAGSGWRLVRVELSSGKLVGILASGPGAPIAFDLTPSGERAFVASWPARVELVRLQDGASLASVDRAGGISGEQILDLVALDRSRALIVSEDGAGVSRVERVALGESPEMERATVLVDHLANLSAVARDPSQLGLAYLAQRTADSLWRLDIETRALERLNASPPAGAALAFPAPSGLAFERVGRSLLVLVNARGQQQLRRLVLREFEHGGAPQVDVLGALPDQRARISSGAANARLVCLPDSQRLAVAGGVEQRRRIGAHDASRQLVTIEEGEPDFEPAPRPGTRWRIATRSGVLTSSPESSENVFLWDSSDVVPGGPVRLRVIPFDSEVGLASVGLASKTVRSRLNSLDPRFALGCDGALDQIPPQVENLATGDFDGDGDLDVVVVSKREDGVPGQLQIAWLEQRFDEAAGHARPTYCLRELASTPALDRPRGAHVLDIDQDGALDFLLANTGGNRTLLFRQTAVGSGAFVASELPFVSGQTGRNPFAVSSGDLDADGDADVVVCAYADDQLDLFENTGGVLSYAGSLSAQGITRHPEAVVVADIDGDGRLDVACANFGDALGLEQPGHSLAVFYGSSDLASWSSAQELSLPGMLGARDLLVLDIDGDGDTDLLSANELSDELVLFLQTDVPRAFAPGQRIGDLGMTPGARSVIALDLDEDGALDLMCVNKLGVLRKLTALFQRPDPGGGIRFELDPGGQFNRIEDGLGPLTVLAADVDGNGGLDLLVGDYQLHLVTYFSESLGRFTPGSSAGLGNPLEETDPNALCLADLDGDGFLDVLVSNAAAGNLSLFHQQAPGVFDPSALLIGQVDTTIDPGDSVCADFDGDGLLDIAVACSGDGSSTSGPESGNVSILRQLPGGGFAAPAVMTLEVGGRNQLEQVKQLLLGDVDGDGDDDLLFRTTPTSSGSSMQIGVLRREGDNPADLFPLADTLASGLEMPISLALTDVDRDGRLDLAYAELCQQRLVLMRQRPTPLGEAWDPGNFDALAFGGGTTVPEDVSGADGLWWPQQLTAADINGDGRPDFVCASRAYNSGALFAALCPNIGELREADRRSALAIFYQDEAGGFGHEPDQLLLLADSVELPNSCRMVDFDGDGDLDLVAAGQYSLGVWRQLTPWRWLLEQTPLDLAEASNYSSLQLADIDGDGDLDAAVCTRRLDRTLLLFGNH